ncbi:MAG: DUF3108 domain-containing protein [Salinarimonas sp.]|nr:DUF3108 domain-containing protein [Salinarimonas sp.]
MRSHTALDHASPRGEHDNLHFCAAHEATPHPSPRARSCARPRAHLRAAGAIAGLVLAFGAAQATPVTAGEMEAVYTISIAGFSVGTADVKSSFDGSGYKIDLQARLTGLAGVLVSGRGAASASGTVSGTRVVPQSFAANSRSSQASRTVRMGLRDGTVSAVEIEPPLQEHADAVPVQAAHRRGVVDPVSAFMMPATVPGNPADPRNCERTIPVFDGAARFDIVLNYAGTREFSRPGYSGEVLVCHARFKAISGHRPSRDAVRFMEENRDMAVWLAPFPANDSLVPMRIEVRTQIGMSVIEAGRVRLSPGSRRAASAQ